MFAVSQIGFPPTSNFVNFAPAPWNTSSGSPFVFVALLSANQSRNAAVCVFSRSSISFCMSLGFRRKTASLNTPRPLPSSSIAETVSRFCLSRSDACRALAENRNWLTDGVLSACGSVPFSK